MFRVINKETVPHFVDLAYICITLLPVYFEGFFIFSLNSSGKFTILDCFWIFYVVEIKFYENHKDQVLFDVRSVVNMLVNYLETGSTGRFNQVNKLIGFSQFLKMSSVPKLIV